MLIKPSVAFLYLKKEEREREWTMWVGYIQIPSENEACINDHDMNDIQEMTSKLHRGKFYRVQFDRLKFDRVEFDRVKFERVSFERGKRGRKQQRAPVYISAAQQTISVHAGGVERSQHFDHRAGKV